MDARHRLIEATQELLWAQGFSATSPKAIQAAAGAGQGSMYHHFSGKADLAAAALQASAAVMRRDAEALLTGDGSALSRIETYLTRQRDSLRGCRMGRMTFDAEVLATQQLLEPVTATFAWLVAALAEVVGEAQRVGDLPAGLNPVEVASTIVASVQGGYVLARAAGDPAAFDAAVAGAVSLLRGARVS
jgi:TetR/AcrR family transcriptional regulator, transcriptional repressor for nem operon